VPRGSFASIGPRQQKDRMRRPTAEQIRQAEGSTLPDIVAPGLGVLFCGINPGLYSAAVGRPFARPGNRFWKALHAGGFTPRVLQPSEAHLLPRYGCGVTDLVARATVGAAALAAEELVAGAGALEAKVRRWAPRWVAVLGVGAYRTAFTRRRAAIGPQPERIGGAGVWVLPNPSGLNAAYRLEQLAELFGALHAEAFTGEPPR
jgi:double-stranded uracil-DNA glycosylase